MQELIERVRGYMRREMPAQIGAPCVFAASGGADSSALVALLCEGRLVDARRSVVAHFDHRLRGDAAAADDRAAVEALARRMGVPLVVGYWDRPRPGEDAARRARYAFLARVAANHGFACVMTGHTWDDQAETVLMRAMRGAGVHGLRGMLPDAPLPVALADERTSGLRVRRPLLCLSREETRGWCVTRGIEFIDDPTNDNTALLRNRVRHELLPRLERAQPGIAGALVSVAGAARSIAAALDAKAMRAIVDETREMVVMDRAVLRGCGRHVAAAAFRAALGRLLGDAREYEARHYRLMAAAVDAHAGMTLDLPRGVRCFIDRATVTLSAGPLRAPEIPPDMAAPLPFAGEVGAWRLHVRTGGPLSLPPDAVVRRRRPGDRLRLPHGGTKKLQDELVDRGVPRRLRDAMPVIARHGDVLWTPVSRIATWAGDGEGHTIDAERRVG